jgi:hypothetical protein
VNIHLVMPVGVTICVSNGVEEVKTITKTIPQDLGGQSP